jgi:CheY-like chemotaxis protein
MLKYSGSSCTLTLAETADQALALIESQPFDLYIFDYCLPEISGIELCRYIRQFDSETPILFFSAMARPDDQGEAIAAGATEYLVKPNDLGRLTKTIERLLPDNFLIPESLSHCCSEHRAA